MSGRPATRSQPSRKGKKAWRKNIDLEDVERAVEERRDAEIVLGNQPLFEVDDVASERHMTKEMKGEKVLKSQEILYKRSAIPALLSVHRKQEKPKSKVKKDGKKLHDLVRMSGRTGEDSAKVRLELDGMVRNQKNDLWGAEEPEALSVKRPKNKAPEAPVVGSQAVDVPAAGKSYNPSLEDWKALIVSENARLEQIEKEEQLANEEKARIEELIRAAESMAEEEVEESSSEDEQNGDEEVRLSVGAPVKNKKKTKQQRARQRKQREAEQMHARLKQLKKNLTALQSQKNETETSIEAVKASKPTEKAPKNLKRAHSKYAVMEADLEVKLSDELGDSLRRLRPEGSIAKDRFRSLQARGLIEARVPVAKKSKHKKKITEKWSYKDITL